MSIRDQALNTPNNLEAGLSAALKACQAAQSALDAVMVSLVMAVSLLEQQDSGEETTECRHLNAIEVAAMGVDSSFICPDCDKTF